MSSKEKKTIYENVWKYKYGRTPEELKRDLELLNQVFFSEEEINKIRVLANLIVPPNKDGNIDDAEVPEFIEFIAKDAPSFQKILKDGLEWVDTISNKEFENNFINCSEIDQKSILDTVAFPKGKKNKEEAFFSTFKDLVITGYFTSEVGINDLGYKGNQPNFWDGVPDEIMKEHGFSYEKDWNYKFVDPLKRNDLAKWDDEGNLIKLGDHQINFYFSCMSEYILSIDAGTTSSRAIIFDKKGDTIGVSQHEFTQFFPKQGWVEHDALEIWNTQLKAIKEVLQKTNIDASQINALGITNQRETTLLWDRNTGIPVHKAIVWQDRRTTNICNSILKKNKGDLFYEKTGLILDSYFSGTKIKWILDQDPDLRKKAENGEIIFGTIDSWLIWNLTGRKVHVTDVTNASRTLLFNIHSLKWDSELLEILDIPEKFYQK